MGPTAELPILLLLYSCYFHQKVIVETVFSPSTFLLLANEFLLLYVQLQAGGISMDMFKALCSCLCCWSCCWLYTEETCPSLGV